MNTVTLSIINLDQLQHAVTARHQFDRTGGTIGSHRATWQVDDREHSVAPVHCEIRWIEGGFCVIDHCQRTYLNDNLDSLGPHSIRRLLNGEQLRIGAYRVLVQCAENDPRSLGDLLNPGQKTLDQLMLEIPVASWQPKPIAHQIGSDICSLFEPGIGNDPLTALDAATGQIQENPLEQLLAGERP